MELLNYVIWINNFSRYQVSGTWLQGKQEKAKLKAEVELTKLQATKKKIEQGGAERDGYEIIR